MVASRIELEQKRCFVDEVRLLKGIDSRTGGRLRTPRQIDEPLWIESNPTNGIVPRTAEIAGEFEYRINCKRQGVIVVCYLDSDSVFSVEPITADQFAS